MCVRLHESRGEAGMDADADAPVWRELGSEVEHLFFGHVSVWGSVGVCR